MKETLLIKHAVGGRTFIDTGKQPVEYRVESDGTSFQFTVKAPPDRTMEELLEWKQELNVFLFREFDDRPTAKIWFYVKDDSVHYDPERELLIIEAQSSIEYVPDLFGGM
ncbi:hypothetical protein PAESOLCIP111_04712 [Paenibacillus solanacearum]|uniref:Uncharacterized protein n=1 Tax=Paenibacillus solanacearum TaxID=2048548 RepID=A0A916K4S6_9BACL|nr:hypothetical protein [Paenibacillus solanacearum]CAG7644469.1 hypothetical protein PAESOLCIP111_04712 [Paenibacillus solanacearum]